MFGCFSLGKLASVLAIYFLTLAKSFSNIGRIVEGLYPWRRRQL